jgi:hypothetical protein
MPYYLKQYHSPALREILYRQAAHKYIELHGREEGLVASIEGDVISIVGEFTEKFTVEDLTL